MFGKFVDDSLNYAFEYGEFSNSQKQAVITLIEKKGKHKRFVKNLRPISFINVDDKLASKTLIKMRLSRVGQFFYAVRTINDVIDYAKCKDILGILVAIDFEKAFDSLNFDFLLRVLHASKFGPSSIQWIRVSYNNASSCVINNGFTPGPLFELSRGVRQGDPLSPYLFIISVESLAIKIREDDSINGITIREESVKLCLFADDMICFLIDISSYTNLFVTLKTFGEISSLKINNEKTEALALGNSRTLWEGHSDLPNLCNTIKIPG